MLISDTFSIDNKEILCGDLLVTLGVLLRGLLFLFGSWVSVFLIDL